MAHYNEEDLILYYYGEGRKRPAIERHLDECGACAATYREIAGTLASVTEPELPERGDQYGLEVWQRIRHKLPDAVPGGRGPWSEFVPWWMLWFRGERLMLVGAAAVLVLAAFVAGRYWPRQGTATVATVPTTTAPSVATTDGAAAQRQRILLTSVADHLDRSERMLTDIMNTSDRRDISTEQRWAEDLLTTSRLYRQDAEDIGEQSVASVLDDLERSLLEIVHSRPQISAADLEQIRRRIDAAALLFKVRVLSDELRQRETAPADTATPRTSTRKIS
ncbi:MAG TPA: hypothetical protein VGQ16_06155 [Vicinamibacterales bacterium]|jgi:hypothetical protein|nr:hypothetical protein [Vicinamibacterales bacterium]